ncbi:MAG: hypothetical protein ACLS85_03515 [Coprobacillus cateniformis]
MDLDVLSKLNYVDLATQVLSTFVPEEGKELIHDACLNVWKVISRNRCTSKKGW